MSTLTAQPFDVLNSYGGIFGGSSSSNHASSMARQLIEIAAMLAILEEMMKGNGSGSSGGGSQGYGGAANDGSPWGQCATPGSSVDPTAGATGGDGSAAPSSSPSVTPSAAPTSSSDSTSSAAPTSSSAPTSTSSSSSATNATAPAGGFADQWNTVRFTNSTNQPMTVQLTMGAGQSLPPGVGSNGQFTIPPGTSKDLTFAENGPGFNFKSTTGDGSAWNQGEVTFSTDASGRHSTAFDMSYIYGYNARMNIHSSDGQVSGYQGDLLANAPANVKAGPWGIRAPLYNGNADASGPQAPSSPQAAYLYNTIPVGMGYVGVGRPAEASDYDDKSTLQTSGSLAVVFS